MSTCSTKPQPNPHTCTVCTVSYCAGVCVAVFPHAHKHDSTLILSLANTYMVPSEMVNTPVHRTR